MLSSEPLDAGSIPVLPEGEVSSRVKSALYLLQFTVNPDKLKLTLNMGTVLRQCK